MRMKKIRISTKVTIPITTERYSTFKKICKNKIATIITIITTITIIMKLL